MVETKNSDVYVTYKWLFATAISILVISLGFIYFVFGGLTRSLDAKANIKWVEQQADHNLSRINILVTQLDKMEIKQDTMLIQLYKMQGMSKRDISDMLKDNETKAKTR